MNKEELVKKICDKLSIEFENKFFDNQTNIEKHNSTVSIYFLKALCNKYKIAINDETKGELALMISDHLKIGCKKGIRKDIGEADQIAATCLEKIYNKINQ